jgi:hypothetical protein
MDSIANSWALYCWNLFIISRILLLLLDVCCLNILE